MIVVITNEAEADLEQIGDFIARDNPLRAITFVQELVERCLGLSDMAHAFLWFHATNTPVFADALTANT